VPRADRRGRQGAYKHVTYPPNHPKPSDQAQNKQKRSPIPGWPLRISKSKAGSFAHFLISDLNVKNQRISPALPYNRVTYPPTHHKSSDHAQNKQKRSPIPGWPLRISKSKAGSFAHFLISDLNVKNQRISPELPYIRVTYPPTHHKSSDHAQNKQKRSTIPGWPLRISKSKAGSFAHFLISDLNVKNQRISPELPYIRVTNCQQPTK